MVPKGWLNRSIENNITFSGGSQPPREVFIDEPKENYIRLIQIRDYKTDKYATYIPKNLAKKFCSPSDVMIGRYGPPIFQILRGIEGAYNVALIKASPKNGVDNDYMYYFLSRESLLRVIESHSQRTSGQTGIEMDVLKSYPMPLPPLSEQKKIAKILSTWDKAITTTEQLLSNSQQQKKALEQQLLTGKKRLGMPANGYDFKKTRYGIIPKDWEYPAIKDVCTQVTEKNTESADYPVLSCSKYDGFVDSLKYFKKKVYSDDTSGYRLIHRGCFGFPSNHVEEGSIGLQNLYDTGIVSPIYVVFRAKPKKVDNTYLYAVLKTDHYRQIFGAATNASVDRRGSLRWKEFSLIHVPLPPLEEQQRISTVLATADQEISALQQKLDALKQEKNALMQQLLTGKRRVVIE
ncbi:restriction endonuclease subunit S [Proteus mirabilis]|uniref:restriction endonuclease subunit S n=1 Tax=Enterobacterales TaxID=91347 RepID=UPI000DE773E7|nr:MULTISPECIES: restriction endonuclease subunit S [Enterobacterales]HDC4435726.1 restriction endonuclease subunit S [Klebsiella quasipneumoniae]EKX9073638.1 restriction endonuclease subunit S [Proteus mirabilis]MBQ0522365.1 restriction endonuclease subunit S [Proteus mirabilis]MBW9446043.1 restriction endonuclease subunit S [Enterobacter sp. EC_50]MDX4950531.1 restriction endonuclease subunit S [Proteus mirabilis]